MASGVSGTSAYQGGVPSGPFTKPTFSFQEPSPPYAAKTPASVAQGRAGLQPPQRPLPASHAQDAPASIRGGRLDAIVTPNDAPTTGISALAEAVTRPVGIVSAMVGRTLDAFGLRQPVVDLTASFLASPLFAGLAKTGAGILGRGLGEIGARVGEQAMEGAARTTLNRISSETGGSALAYPALKEMSLGGPGWKGLLDGLLAENGGMNLYSTFFLGNLKNRTDGGTGPQFYKQLVYDVWDQNPGGREFLASVGESAVSRPKAAEWFADYYYDILDQEDGSGVATKVADTLGYRFGLDAENINKIYKPGADRAAAFARAHRGVAADLAGDSSIARPPERLSPQEAASTPPLPVTAGGLTPANSAYPTGPEYSGLTSHTRAYRNAPGDGGPFGRAVAGGATGLISLISGPLMAAAGGILGQEGMGKVAATAFQGLFSQSGGAAFGALIDGIRAAPEGDRTATALARGVLTSGAGTAYSITAAQQFPKERDGVEFFREIMRPLKAPGAEGLSIMDRLIKQAPENPALANNMRAIADELDESLSAKAMLKEIGQEDFIGQVREALPVAAPYASVRQGPQADLPLNHPARLGEMFGTALPDGMPLRDASGAPTPFANVGLRLFGHDVLDGKLDGDVTLRTLYNPVGSGNDDFRRNVEYVKKWGEIDLKDDGALNGSALRNLARDYQRLGAAQPAAGGLAATGIPAAAASRPSFSSQFPLSNGWSAA